MSSRGARPKSICGLMAYSFSHLHDEVDRRPGSEAAVAVGRNAGARAESMVPSRPSVGNELGLLPAVFRQGHLLVIVRFN